VRLSRSLLLWAAIVPVAGFELFAAILAGRPDADPAYRAYYVDKSTDCWRHATAARYVLGTTLSFVAGREPLFFPNKICGWYYPGPSGTWSYGGYSLLQFNFAPAGGPLRLYLTAGAMVNATAPQQRVTVTANGAEVAALRFDSSEAELRTVEIPAAIARSGSIELRFDYPDARPGREMGPNEDNHPRAIRMVALTLDRAGSGNEKGGGPPPPPYSVR
jgi:hypothetical protein